MHRRVAVLVALVLLRPEAAHAFEWVAPSFEPARHALRPFSNALVFGSGGGETRSFADHSLTAAAILGGGSLILVVLGLGAHAGAAQGVGLGAAFEVVSGNFLLAMAGLCVVIALALVIAAWVEARAVPDPPDPLVSVAPAPRPSTAASNPPAATTTVLRF